MIEVKGFKGPFEFLSNFSRHGFWFMGHWYKTNEHFYQAAKCADSYTAYTVREAATPGYAKKRGVTVQLVVNWDEIKLGVMALGLQLKFTQNADIRQLLTNTDGMYLEETNPWGDTYWGVCRGEGKNMLGHLLMVTRDALK